MGYLHASFCSHPHKFQQSVFWPQRMACSFLKSRSTRTPTYVTARRPLRTLWHLIVKSWPHLPASPAFPSPRVPRKLNWPFPSLDTIKALSSLRFQMFKGVGSTPNFAFLPHMGIWLLSLLFLNFSHGCHQESLKAKMQLTFSGPYLSGSVCCIWLS